MLGCPVMISARVESLVWSFTPLVVALSFISERWVRDSGRRYLRKAATHTCYGVSEAIQRSRVARLRSYVASMLACQVLFDVQEMLHVTFCHRGRRWLKRFCHARTNTYEPLSWHSSPKILERLGLLPRPVIPVVIIPLTIWLPSIWLLSICVFIGKIRLTCFPLEEYLYFPINVFQATPCIVNINTWTENKCEWTFITIHIRFCINIVLPPVDDAINMPQNGSDGIILYCFWNFIFVFGFVYWTIGKFLEENSVLVNKVSIIWCV